MNDFTTHQAIQTSGPCQKASTGRNFPIDIIRGLSNEIPIFFLGTFHDAAFITDI